MQRTASPYEPKTMKTIKSWAEEDRPREKMLAKGKEALSNAELIAILIGSGNNKESAVDLSRRILNDRNDNLIELSRLSINDLMKYKGIGEAKAISIVAALELGRRRRFSEALEKPSIKNSQIAYECFYAHLSDLDHEQFWIMLLNNRHFPSICNKRRISFRRQMLVGICSHGNNKHHRINYGQRTHMVYITSRLGRIIVLVNTRTLRTKRTSEKRMVP